MLHHAIWSTSMLRLMLDDISKCLLSIEDRGKKLHSEFNARLLVTGNDNPGKNFWDPIKMQEWKDFSNNFKKTKAKSSRGKTIEVAVQRDILGFLFAKPQELNLSVDMEEALKYPLSLIPLSIAHADGEKRKTNKSALFDYAFGSTTVLRPDLQVNGNKMYVLDLTPLIRSTVKVPATFEELAMNIYNDIPRCYENAYVACDTYRAISIKSPGRPLRGESNKFIIHSSKVNIPPDFQKFLCNGDNKERSGRTRDRRRS